MRHLSTVEIVNGITDLTEHLPAHFIAQTISCRNEIKQVSMWREHRADKKLFILAFISLLVDHFSAPIPSQTSQAGVVELQKPSYQLLLIGLLCLCIRVMKHFYAHAFARIFIYGHISTSEVPVAQLTDEDEVLNFFVFPLRVYHCYALYREVLIFMK